MKNFLYLLPFLSLVTTAVADDPAPPNIVLILSDDQGYTDYGFMGHPEIETPNLDKLARESALFRRGYVPTALCRPSLFGESFAHDIADIENPQASLLYRWVIRGHDKLLLTYDGAPGKMKYPPQSGEPQLFDLNEDPSEKRNLATENPGLVKELSSLLDEWYVPSQRQAGKFVSVAPKRRKQ